MPRYVETNIKLSREQLENLRSAIEAGAEIVLSAKIHRGKKPIEDGELVSKIPLTLAQKEKIGQGKPIKFSSAHSKFMRGRGILTDSAKLGSAIVQQVADEFLPDSDAANKVGDFLFEAAEFIERGLTGKKQFDYGQAAKNEKTSIENAKAFLQKSSDAQMSQWKQMQGLPFVPKMSFADYKKMMVDLSGRSPRSADSIKKARLARMRGDETAQSQASELIQKGKDQISKAITGQGKRRMKGGENVNQQIAEYLRQYLDAD